MQNILYLGLYFIFLGEMLLDAARAMVQKETLCLTFCGPRLLKCRENKNLPDAQ
jgi:hypothetical protein